MKISDNLKKIIGAMAPTLGAALGGPLGGLAGTIIASKLGTDNGDEVLAKLNSDPSALASLREAELEFQKHLDDNQIDLAKIAAADTADARARETALHDPTTRLIAFTLLGAFIAMAGAVLFGWAKADSTIAGTIIGYLSAKAELILSYYFGSSRSSVAKDDTIAQIAKAP